MQNRLATSSSPYLQQHADNPVHWQPWDQDALDLARSLDRPILLSIGYSACHWCHVMAHESFEDEETAKVMNELFVNIKVDREERPDLDRIYQSAHQLLAQRSGGWPLTLFLTPGDQQPFFAGTYFPKEPRHGLPPFQQILRNIAGAYREQHDEIREQNQALQQALSQLNPETQDGITLNNAPLEKARQQLARNFDEQYGGFGQAPKFPHPTNLNRLLHHWAETKIRGTADPRALYIVDHTLTTMARSGINDQLDGGFYRYSVDDEWMIPHFEKMLYDNGPLLCLYADLWLATGKMLFKTTTERTADWVIHSMQSAEGGYYSAWDADSEGVEGRYYSWTPEAARELLDEDEYRHLAHYYGLDHPANFEEQWHLHQFASVADLNKLFDSTAEQAHALLESARLKLLNHRQSRIPPGRDEKILTSWNALMIKGMARAGRVLGEQRYIASAEQAADFIHKQLWQNGRLLASHKDGHSHLAAYLDDYAYLIDALLELLQTRWNSNHLNWAIELADQLLLHFEDKDREGGGGFYFTADDHEALIHRPKPYGDDSTPSGNGVAANVLTRLSHITGNERYQQAAEGVLKNVWQQIQQLPHAHCSLLEALADQLSPPELIIIRGTGNELTQWQNRAIRHYAPHRITLAIPADEKELPGLLLHRSADTETLAYICRGTQCELPCREFDSFEALLAENECLPEERDKPDFQGGVGSFRRARE